MYIGLCPVYHPADHLQPGPAGSDTRLPTAIIQQVKELGMIDDMQVPGSKRVIVKKATAALLIAALCALAVWHSTAHERSYRAPV